MKQHWNCAWLADYTKLRVCISPVRIKNQLIDGIDIDKYSFSKESASVEYHRQSNHAIPTYWRLPFLIPDTMEKKLAQALGKLESVADGVPISNLDHYSRTILSNQRLVNSWSRRLNMALG